MKFTISLVLLLICSCRNESEQAAQVSIADPQWSSNHSVDFNQEIHAREELDIAIYLEHHKDLKMKQIIAQLLVLFFM